MNLNSLCNLTDATSMAMWKPAILSTYGNSFESPDYIRELTGPMRPTYPDGMAERELLTSIAQVLIKQTVYLVKSHLFDILFREDTTMHTKRILQL